MNKHRSALRRYLRLACLLIPLAFAPSGAAAAPAPKPASAESSGAAQPGAPAEDIPALLANAERELALIDASDDAAAPPGASQDALQQKRYLLLESIRAYKRLLQNRYLIETLGKELEEARRRAEGPVKFTETPPYSVLLLDRLLREKTAQEHKVDSLRGRADSLESVLQYLNEQLLAAGSASRQAEERLLAAGASPPVDLVWARELARANVRANSALVRATESSGRITQIQIAIAQQESSLAGRRVAAVAGHTVFPESDLQTINAELDRELDAATKTTRRILDAENADIAKAAAAQRALDQAIASQAGDIAPLQAAVRDAQKGIVEAGARVGAARLQPIFIQIARVAWNYRYRLAQGKSPELLAEINTQHAQLSQRFDLMEGALDRLLKEAGAEDALKVAERPDARAASADLQRARLLESKAREVLARLADEAEVTRASLTFSERVSLIGAQGAALLGRLWDFELFTLEQTIEVDGKKVTGTSSITVGKISRAIFLFILGILLAHWSGQVGERFVIRSFHYEAMRARILRKWLFALGVLLLLVAVLAWVNIPLTVFAFFGGAIAIGVGFGMQTMLKNLISGLMLLFERPFRPGDLIEVGALKGTVREIGIRSSIIRDFNGIDTLIPNSTLVEQNVTNWVHDSPKVRSSVSVGVAYGSPVKEVVRLLEEAADRHKLVLAEPASKVLFANFGANALEFVLLHWIEVGPEASTSQVASDLRFMIEKSFREHGIVMECSQRDVHLSCEQPLAVRLLAAGEGDARAPVPPPA